MILHPLIFYFKYFLLLYLIVGISSGVGEVLPEFNKHAYKDPNYVIPKYFSSMPLLLEKCKTNELPVKFVKKYLMNDMIVKDIDSHIITRVFCWGHTQY